MPTSPLPLADDDGNYPGNSNSNSNSNDETFVAERRRSSFSMLSDADGHMLSAKESLELIALRARVEHLEVEKSQGQGAGGNASTAAAGGSGGSANNVAAFQAAGAELYHAGMVAGRRASMSEAEKARILYIYLRLTHTHTHTHVYTLLLRLNATRLITWALLRSDLFGVTGNAQKIDKNTITCSRYPLSLDRSVLSKCMHICMLRVLLCLLIILTGQF